MPDIKKWDLSNLSKKENILEDCPLSITSKIKKEKNEKIINNEITDIDILLLGDENVGKKSLFKQFKFKNFEEIERMCASSKVSDDWNTYIKKIIIGNIFAHNNDIIFNFKMKNLNKFFCKIFPLKFIVSVI